MMRLVTPSIIKTSPSSLMTMVSTSIGFISPSRRQVFLHDLRCVILRSRLRLDDTSEVAADCVLHCAATFADEPFRKDSDFACHLVYFDAE
jgi:hypothetical protein